MNKHYIVIITILILLTTTAFSCSVSETKDEKHIKSLELIQIWMRACGYTRSFDSKVKVSIGNLLDKGKNALEVALSEGLDEHLKLFPEAQRAQVKKDYMGCVKNVSSK